jgi:hypothetical protein
MPELASVQRQSAASILLHLLTKPVDRLVADPVEIPLV